jgi:ADP-heptose:LPS heptosyltransferase
MKKIISKFILLIKIISCFFIDNLACLFAKNISREKNILTLCSGGLGDFIILLQIYKEVKKYFPSYKIYCVTNQAIAVKIPYFDEVLPVDTLNKFFLGNLTKFKVQYIFYRFKNFIRLNKSYDFIFDFNKGHILFSSLTCTLKAANKITYLNEGKSYVKFLTKKCYTKFVVTKEKHILWSAKEFLKQVIPDYKVQNDEYYLPNLCGMPIERHILFEQKDYFIIAMGSSTMRCNWQCQKYVKFAENIKTEIKNIVLIGTAAEKELGKYFVENYKGGKNIINLIDKTAKTDELLSVIKYAKFFIGNDTGTTHLAAALQIPSICVFQVSNFGTFFPYFADKNESLAKIKNICVYNKMDCFNCMGNCKYKLKSNEVYPCVAGIEVKQVLQEFEILKNYFKF